MRGSQPAANPETWKFEWSDAWSEGIDPEAEEHQPSIRSPLDMHEEMRLRTEQRERVAAERNHTKLRRQQSGRGLTVALATPDGDELINCMVRGAVDDLNLTTDAVPSLHPAGQEDQDASGCRLQLRRAIS
jgi:hypothetical protein